MLPVLFLDEIKRWSKEFSIEIFLIQAIIMKESGWNPFVVRYEPNYRYLFEPSTYAQDDWINLSTEINTQKISWGLGQIMGALAREQGHKGMMGELVKPDLNIKHICIRLATIKKRCKNFDEILAVYNGGFEALRTTNGHFKNEDYVKSTLGYLIKYQNQ